MTEIAPNMTDYEGSYRDDRLEVPEFFNFGTDIVDRWAEDRTKLALLSADPSGLRAQRHTFWDLKVLSDRAANGFRQLGIRKGDRVFIMLPRIPDWYVAMLGLFKLGALPMPGTTLLTPKDIEYRINRSEAVMAVTDPENAAKVEAAAAGCPTLKHLVLAGGEQRGWVSFDSMRDDASTVLEGVEPTRSDDPLLIYFTSGTVGYPKMVLHTQASYGIGHTLTAKYWQDLKSTDLHWTLSETGWAKAAYGKLFGQWTIGATVMQHDARGRFDAALTLRMLERYGVTSFCAPPTAYRMMVLEDLTKYDLSNLRHCTGAGEPLNPEVMKQWEDGTGLAIYDGYGQTETVLLVGNFRCLPVRPGSMGKPMPGFAIGVVDEEGSEVAPGEGRADRGQDKAGTAGGPVPGVLARRRSHGAFFLRRLVPDRRQGLQGRRRVLLVLRAGRRRDHFGRIQNRPVRSGKRSHRAPRSGGVGGGSQPRPGAGRHR